jgi:hypothetical protein
MNTLALTTDDGFSLLEDFGDYRAQYTPLPESHPRFPGWQVAETPEGQPDDMQDPRPLRLYMLFKLITLTASSDILNAALEQSELMLRTAALAAAEQLTAGDYAEGADLARRAAAFADELEIYRELRT